MLNLSLEDLDSNHPLLWLSQLLPAVVVDFLDLSLNRSNSNSNSNNNQQVVYSDHNQNLGGRDCLGQRPRASHNSRDSKEEVDCLGRVQGRERERGLQVLEEGCLDQRSSSNSPRLVDCLEVRRGRWGRVREDCLDSSQNLREGCLEVLLRLRLRLPLAVVVDFLDRLCNSPNSRSSNSSKEASLGRLRSLLRLEGCLDQQLSNRNNRSSSSKVEGCSGTLDSHKPSLRVVCLALAHLVLHNNSNRKAACLDPLLGSLPIRLASFSNPRLFSRVCSRACLV